MLETRRLFLRVTFTTTAKLAEIKQCKSLWMHFFVSQMKKETKFTLIGQRLHIATQYYLEKNNNQISRKNKPETIK